MAYLGNDLQVAFPTYRNIDDISGSFNGVTTSFPLTVAGVAPIPAPINSQQCLISVNGVVQRPDDSGAEGFRLSGGNIIFASAPAGGVDFFGVILAGADYVNIGANFPSGTAVAPSITFDSDLDTGIYNPAGNQIGFTTSGVQRLVINSSGQISGGLGTAAAPVISFISDPNTGIYSPGADQVAISTGGSGRLFVDASGRLGVGTSSPVSTLSIRNDSLGSGGLTETAIALTYSSTNYGQHFIDANGTYNIYANNNGVAGGNLQLRADTGLIFNTASNERLRITSAGLVGVGTSSPSGTLHLKHATDANIFFRNGTSAGLSTGTILECFNDATNATTPLYARASQFQFGTDSGGTFVPRMTVDSSGRVGIGTTSPGYPLHVIGGTNGIQLVGTDNLNSGWRIATPSSNVSAFGALDSQSTAFGTFNGSTNAFTERARIDSSGRLLVGTSSVRASFQRPNINVEGLSDGGITICRNNADASGPVLEFGKTRSTSIGGVAAVTSGDFLGLIRFYGANGSTLDNEAARISAEVDGAVSGGGANDMPGRLVFSTTADGASSPTERLRISSDGAVGFANGSIVINSTAIASGAGTNALKWNSSTGVVTYDTSSRLIKENIIDCPYGIDELKQLRPRKYFRTDDKKEEIGFVADEVVLVLPEFVPIGPKLVITRNEDDTEEVPLGVNYDKLTAVLTKALQEAIAKIESLEARLTAAGI